MTTFWLFVNCRATEMYKKMKKKLSKLFGQIIRFGLVGGVVTSISLIIYWGCIRIGCHYLLGNALAFVITVAISYVLNNIFTFRDGRNNVEWSLVALIKVYFSYFFTGIVISSILLWFWNDCIGINKDLSPILNLFFTIPMNFVLSKLWAYRKWEWWGK